MKHLLPFALLAVLILLMAGCGDKRPSQPGGEAHPIGLSATLESIGTTLAWTGALAASVGLGLRIAIPLVLPALAPFAGLFGAICVWGGAALAVGLGSQWLASNLWLLAATIAFSLAGLVLWHWRDLRRIWLRYLARVAKPR